MPTTVPGQTTTLVAAVDWIAGLLTGSLATLVAVLAIAGVGLALLQGRIQVSRAVTVIIGCFVLFGAHAIAAGLVGLANRDRGTGMSQTVSPATTMPKAPPPPGYDPYAGASVPQ